MDNKKSTKRALLTGIFSLLFCMSMLIGTTFAWFTNSVTSTNNIIKSGDLDIDFEYSTWDAENDTWTAYSNVEDAESIFDENALYEPGYTEIVKLKVTNKGNLAAKVKMNATIKDVKEGVNRDGETFKLSEYLQVGVASVEDVTDRASADAVKKYDITGTSMTLSDMYNDSTAASSGDPFDPTATYEVNMTEEGDYTEVVFVLTMPTTVGNEANHNGVDVPEVTVSFSAVATQDGVESDSFGSDYDNQAVYDGEVQMERQPWHELDAVKADTTVDGGGYTYATEYQEVCLAGDADLTIKGVTFQNGLTVYTDGDASGTVTLEDCTIYLNDGSGNSANATMNQNYADYGLYIGAIDKDVNYVFKNCTFTAYDTHNYTNAQNNSYNVYIGGNYSADSITFEGCTFEGSGKHGIGCSYAYSTDASNPFTYYNLAVTGCDFKDWNNNNQNGAAIRGNVPADVLTTYSKSINISGNTFGNSNGSNKDNVVIDGWNGTWN